MEKRQCQNCSKTFRIEDEDFAFYERMKVPAPTWCPECRLRRRLAFRNERSLYQRTCDLCKQHIISGYPASVPFPVYCQACWFSDNWDPMDYGRDYDFSKPFFQQMAELFQVVPRIGLNSDLENLPSSPYANLAGVVKDCHLVFYTSNVENSLYSTNIFFSKDCVDCTKVQKLESSYGSFNCRDSYNVVSSVDCRNSFNVYFSKNLSDCLDCFGCVNLRHKQYHIFNQSYTKEEYERRMAEFNIGSYHQFQKLKQQAEQFWQQFPVPRMYGHKNEDVSGNYIEQSKNVKNSFDVVQGENLKYCCLLTMPTSTDCYDYSDWGEHASLVYETLNSGQQMHYVIGTLGSWNGSNWYYCDTIRFSSDCFGCSMLNKKQFCILNKQYTEAEYKVLVPKIIQHMKDMPYVDALGRTYSFGDFFPPELSFFGYNETVAQQLFPLKEEEAIRQGWKWTNAAQKSYPTTKAATDLPDHIGEVDDGVTKETIVCQHAGECVQQCSYAFKIIPQELAFYRRFGLPLPRLCSNCRQYERMKWMNPYALWQRQCMCTQPQHDHKGRCTVEFETTYSPDRLEIVYCEPCYQKEIY